MSLPNCIPRCPDWVFSTASNVHIAKDRAWFTEYTVFPSSVLSLALRDEKVPVIGIGTVKLQVKRFPGATGRHAHSIITLHNVLHVPSAICNILGTTHALLSRYTITLSINPSSGSKGEIRSRDGGTIVACFDPRRPLYMLTLSGPPVGARVIKDDGPALVLSMRWPDPERQRWERYQEFRRANRNIIIDGSAAADERCFELFQESDKGSCYSQLYQNFLNDEVYRALFWQHSDDDDNELVARRRGEGCDMWMDEDEDEDDSEIGNDYADDLRDDRVWKRRRVDTPISQ